VPGSVPTRLACNAKVNDWVHASTATVIHCLDDDFYTYLSRELMISSIPPTADHHAYYGDFFFQHHTPSTKDADHEYLTRCVQRFRTMLASDDTKLFLQTFVNRHGEMPTAEMRAACLLAARLNTMTKNAGSRESPRPGHETIHPY
jgi:hypothetical protein